MKTGDFQLATISFKPHDVISLELSSSNEDSGHLKTSGVGGLEIGMSISCRCSFKANWQLE